MAAPDPVREHRPAHLPGARQPLRRRSGAFEALPGIARKTGRPGLKIASREEAEREINQTARLGGRFMAADEPDYPKALRAIRFGAAADRGPGKCRGSG